MAWARPSTRARCRAAIALATRASRGGTIWWSTCGIIITWIFQRGDLGRGVRFRLGGPRGFRVGKWWIRGLGEKKSRRGSVYVGKRKIWGMKKPAYSTFYSFFLIIFTHTNFITLKISYVHFPTRPSFQHIRITPPKGASSGPTRVAQYPWLPGSGNAIQYANQLFLHIDSSLSFFLFVSKKPASTIFPVMCICIAIILLDYLLVDLHVWFASLPSVNGRIGQLFVFS
jgi:hypothetical protein